MIIGSDGELSYEYFLKRISEIASLKGLIDIKGYDKECSRIVESVLGKVNTEASKIPLDAFNEAYGEISIRNGTRKVSPLSVVMFFLDPIKVAETTPLYDLVRGSSSLEEVNKRLNEVVFIPNIILRLIFTKNLVYMLLTPLRVI
ncbi:MAG: DUF1152 domain-containing protein [Saccharolobus sp.]